MILKIRHRGLKKLFESGDPSALNAKWVSKLERILSLLEVAKSAEGMNIPGFYLHPLKGRFAGYWSVRVSGNWRLIFRFEGTNATDLDLVDYH